jgi:hypothetical protein
MTPKVLAPSGDLFVLDTTASTTPAGTKKLFVESICPESIC